MATVQQDKVLEAEKLGLLRREISIGLADAAERRFSRKSVREIADEVRQEQDCT
jgi:antitoxin ParD1/3/4